MKRVLALVLLSFACKKASVVAGRVEDAGALQPVLERAKVRGIAIAVVRDGEVTRTEAAGNVTDDTPMEAASIAKTLVGIAVMQLAEQGKLGLDDDASSCAGFDLKKPVSLRMLLAHTSGLKDPPDLEDRNDPDLDAFLRTHIAYAGEPGEKKLYSNVGVSIAALCVEKRSKQAFGAYARTKILEPLGTKATYRPSHAVYPVVDLYASAGDLGKLLAAIERGGDPILTRASTDAMLEGTIGWQAIDLEGRTLLGHEGETRTASTAMFFDRKAKSGAVVLANGDAFASGDPARAKALQDLLSELLQRK